MHVFLSKQRDKVEGTAAWEFQKENSDWTTPSPEPKQWQAFADDPQPEQQPNSKGNTVQSVRTRNGKPNKQAPQATSGFESWGFGSETFTAVPVPSVQRSRTISEGNTSQRFGDSKMRNDQTAHQPAGWAGF